MVFSSAVFLFVFLPVTFLLSRVIPGRRGQNVVLTAVSLIFYAFGNLLYLPLLLGSALINYTGGRLVMRACGRESASSVSSGSAGERISEETGAAEAAETSAEETPGESAAGEDSTKENIAEEGLTAENAAAASDHGEDASPKRRRRALAVTIALNLCLLGIFKYTDFVLETVNSLAGLSLPLPGIELPIGISFFTFQGMSYVIDVYREPETGSRSFSKVLLYISFFPQLVAGPIVKYKDVSEQIDSRVCTPEMTSDGIVRFVRGLSKKLLLADTVGAVADSIFALTAAELDLRLAWLGAVCYCFQIFYDFSGYSDMAIGLGKMFGFSFLENFTHPYASTSIKEFWRRWHISLSSWFRDYLYIPLGGNRKGALRTTLNKLIVFFCTGLWHGANWTFVLWGMWHGACSLLEDFLRSRHIEFPKLFGRIWTILMVLLAFVLFRADTVEQAGMMYAKMFTGVVITTQTSATLARLLSPTILTALIACAVFSFPVAEHLRRLVEAKGAEGTGAAPLVARALPALTQAASLLLLVIDVMALAGASYSPFIYFQF